MLGIGGTSCFLRGVRPGDGDRNVRSLIELTLGLLCCLLFLPRSRLAGDDNEEVRRCVLLEEISATFVGALGCARKAAAAAAEDNDGAGLPRMKADAAAVVALRSAVSFVRGYRIV